MIHRRIRPTVMAALAGAVVFTALARAQTPAASDTLQLRAQVHVLKTENAQLRALLADAQAKLASAQLTSERAGLEEEVKKALGCAQDAPIDWQTLASGTSAGACTPQSATPPAPKPAVEPKPKP